MDAEAVEKVLERSRSLIQRDLILSQTVLDLLRDDGVISETNRQKMEKLDTPEQISYLIDVLCKRGSSTFKRFLLVLKKTFHGTLANKLILCDPVRFSDVLKENEDPFNNPQYARPFSGPYSGRNRVNDIYVPTATEKQDPTKEDVGTLHEQTYRGETPPKYFVINGNGREALDPDDELGKLKTHFESQQSETERVLAALKQEEVVIRELLEQNMKEQEQFRQNRSTLEEINRRVTEISTRTGYLADAVPRLSVSNFRLSALNNLPWTAGKTEF